VRRHIFTLAIVGTGVGLLGVAQTPPPKPPELLPPSISGRPHEPVTPTAATTPAVNPIDRFRVPGYPQETLAAVESVQDAANWLTRMCKADGRVVAGIDPVLKREVPGSDLAQAFACRALARAARFAGDDKTAAAASQCCLTLLTLTKPDEKTPTVRVPTLAADRGNKVGFAALLAAAIYDLPTPDAKLVAEADGLCQFLYSRLRSDGSVHYTEGTDPPAKTDPAGANLYPGLCFQALMASDRVKAEPWKREAVARGADHYRKMFAAEKSVDMCASMLPAVCDLGLRVKSDAVNSFAFEMADYLCDQQYTTSDARNRRWVGGVRPAGGAEPTAQTATCAEGICAAVALAVQVPDATRFARYRQAAVAALNYGRSLQFSASNGNAEHFVPTFRTQALFGGVHGSPSDGLIRADHTAHLLTAQLRFLESGAEKMR
jgi:hypothetical protein